MTTTPFGDGGRYQSGRFTKGNRGGPGNPLAGKIGKFRGALIAAVTEDDIREVAQGLIATAKGGDVRAVKELLDRTLGRPVEVDMIDRLEALEAAVSDAEAMRKGGA